MKIGEPVGEVWSLLVTGNWSHFDGESDRVLTMASPKEDPILDEIVRRLKKEISGVIRRTARYQM